MERKRGRNAKRKFTHAKEKASVVDEPFCLGNNGATSGIVFRATTSEPTTVTFKIRNPVGDLISIGSKATAEEGVELKLQYEPSTEIYSLSHPYGAVWAFNKNGKIIRMSTGCCGLGAFDSVNIDYTADGQITRITNPAGQWFEFEYGENAKISKVKDLTGRETIYFYDENNNLVKFIDAIGRETAYSYCGVVTICQKNSFTHWKHEDLSEGFIEHNFRELQRFGNWLKRLKPRP